MYRCKTCGKEKDDGEFYKTNRSNCKKCLNSHRAHPQFKIFQGDNGGDYFGSSSDKMEFHKHGDDIVRLTAENHRKLTGLLRRYEKFLKGL